MVAPVKTFVPLFLSVVLASLANSGSAQERRVELRFQGGVEVGVPIFLDVDRDIVKPGASLKGWGGFDIGWIVFDLSLIHISEPTRRRDSSRMPSSA